MLMDDELQSRQLTKFKDSGNLMKILGGGLFVLGYFVTLCLSFLYSQRLHHKWSFK